MAGKPTGYSEDELALLSEEERAGLLDPNLVDDPPEEEREDNSAAAQIEAQRVAEQEAAAKAAEEAKAKESQDDPDKAAADKAAADAKAAADEEALKAAAAAGAGGEPEKPAAETAKPAAPTAAPRWEAPENAKEKLADIEKRKDELHARFDDGELTGRELREQMKPLDREEQELRDGVFKATVALDWNKDQYFTQTVPTFLKDHPEYAAGSPLNAALDLEVRKLQAASSNPFDPQILQDAHKTVRENTLKALGIDPKTITEPGKTGTAAATQEKRDIPPTLRDVPAADITESGVISKFDYLDKLSGTAYEDAVAKLSEAERDQYLQGA